MWRSVPLPSFSLHSVHSIRKRVYETVPILALDFRSLPRSLSFLAETASSILCLVILADLLSIRPEVARQMADLGPCLGG